jgi:NAD(P)H-binding
MLASIQRIVLLLLLTTISNIHSFSFSSIIQIKHLQSSSILHQIHHHTHCTGSFLKPSTTVTRNYNKKSSSILLSKNNNNDSDDDDVDNAINDVKFNKKRNNNNKKDSTDNNEILSKDDIVKAVGETFRRRKQQGLSSDTTDDDNIDSKDSSTTDNDDSTSLLDRINPFKAGQTLRKTIDETINQISSPVTTDPTQSKYYIDDRFLERVGGGDSSSAASATISMKGKSLSDVAKLLWEQDDYIPEVLVVGASGEVGRLIVKRLTLTGRCRVRVLVRDLYTKTLNMFGTSVTYCQGDLNNIDSLQYAVTDIDKLIFCATPPQPDEEQFRTKFNEYVQENLGTSTSTSATTTRTTTNDDTTTNNNNEWEQLESVLDVRAKLAEQVDCIGIQNLVRAYQDVRHADYGTSQAAKRSLFKFEKDRPDDFYLFSINNEDDSTSTSSSSSKSDDDDEYEYDKSTSTIKFGSSSSSSTTSTYNDNDYNYDEYDDDDDTDEYNYDNYKDEGYDDETTTMIEQRNGKDVAVKVQTQWIPNRFYHGVFVGRVPSSSSGGGTRSSGTASIISTRLRSRDDPENGIDLGGTSTSSSAAPFAGFIVRLCADGGTYEAFIRTGLYSEYNIEYVCEFSTATKSSTTLLSGDNTNTNIINKSKNKFVTIRLPFESFKAVRHTSSGTDDDTFTSNTIPPFKGRDVQYLGFRYRASKNTQQQSKRVKNNDWSKFYLSLSYIKLYRSQPEPEIIYLSDARIPAVVRDGMVKHGSRRLVLPTSSSSITNNDDDSNNNVLVDDTTFQQAAITKKAMTDSKLVKAIGRSPEEIYYKYRGEEIVKKSGLSYAIVRVTGFNEVSSGEASTIDVSSIQPPSLSTMKNNDNDISTYVSRDEIAQVCVNALLDPNALNKSFYVTKKSMKDQQTVIVNDDDKEIASKFASLPADVIA